MYQRNSIIRTKMNIVQLKQITQLQRQLHQVQMQNTEQNQQYNCYIQQYEQQIQEMNEKLKNIPLAYKSKIQQLQDQIQILHNQVQEQEQQYMLILKLNDEHITTITQLKNNSQFSLKQKSECLANLKQQQEKCEHLTLQLQKEKDQHQQQLVVYENTIKEMAFKLEQQSKEKQQYDKQFLEHKYLSSYLTKTIQHLIIKINDNLTEYTKRITTLSNKINAIQQVVQQIKQFKEQKEAQKQEYHHKEQKDSILSQEQQLDNMYNSVIQHHDKFMQTDTVKQQTESIKLSNEQQQQIIDLQNQILALKQQNNELNGLKIKNTLEIDKLKRQLNLNLIQCKQAQLLQLDDFKQQIVEIQELNNKYFQYDTMQVLRKFIEKNIHPFLNSIQKAVTKATTSQTPYITIPTSSPSTVQNKIRKKIQLNLSSDYGKINSCFNTIKQLLQTLIEKLIIQLQSQNIINTNNITELPKHIQFKKECFKNLHDIKYELNELIAKKESFYSQQSNQTKNLQTQLAIQQNKLVTLQQKALKSAELNDLQTQLIEKTKKQVLDQQKKLQNQLENIKLSLQQLIMCKIDPDIPQNLEIKFMKQQQLLDNLQNELKAEKIITNNQKQEINELKLNEQQILNVNLHLGRIQLVVNKINLIATAESRLIDAFVPETMTQLQKELRKNALVLIDQNNHEYGQLQRLHDTMLANYSFWKQQFGQCIIDDNNINIIHNLDQQLVEKLIQNNLHQQNILVHDEEKENIDPLIQQLDKSQNALFGSHYEQNDIIQASSFVSNNCLTAFSVYQQLLVQLSKIITQLDGQNIYMYFTDLFKQIHQLVSSDKISYIFPGTELLSEAQTCDFIIKSLQSNQIGDVISKINQQISIDHQLNLSENDKQHYFGCLNLQDFFTFSVFLLVLHRFNVVESQNTEKNVFPALSSPTQQLSAVILSENNNSTPQTTQIK